MLEFKCNTSWLLFFCGFVLWNDSQWILETSAVRGVYIQALIQTIYISFTLGYFLCHNLAECFLTCSYNTWLGRTGVISKHDVNSWEMKKKSFPEVTLFSTVGISWRVSLGGGGGGGSSSFGKLDKIKQGYPGNALYVD